MWLNPKPNVVLQCVSTNDQMIQSNVVPPINNYSRMERETEMELKEPWDKARVVQRLFRLCILDQFSRLNFIN